MNELLFKVWFPDTGEVEDDGIEFWGYDAEHVAGLACHYDYHYREGYERMNEDFRIHVKNSEGKVFKFKGRHEESVEHFVEGEAPSE